MSVASETLVFDKEIKTAASVLRAVNHSFRRKILFLLDRRGELSVTDIHVSLRVEQSIVSNHLSILRSAGVVKAERDGKFILYRLDQQRLATVNQLALELCPKKS